MRWIWLRFAQNRPINAQLMLIGILFWIGSSAFFDFYLLRNNRNQLDSTQIQINQAATHAPIDLGSVTMTTTGLTTQAQQTWLKLALPITMFSVVGLIAGWPRGGKAPAPAEL